MLEQHRAAGAADNVADEQKSHQPAFTVDEFGVGQNEIERLVVRLVGNRLDLADAIGDADRDDRLQRPQARERQVVMAGAIADAMAAPVERGERHEQQVGIESGRLGRRLGNAHLPGDGRLAGPPAAEHERLAAGAGDRQRGRNARARERGEQRQRVGFVAHGMEGGDAAAP